MLCQKIISGGQTGVDRGALDAALELQFPCGGWCPTGREAEDGIIDGKYPLQEISNGGYSDRTKKNVEDSDGTLILYKNKLLGGSNLTYKYAKSVNKPVHRIKIIDANYSQFLPQIINWINQNQIQILNVAGPRASEWPNGYKHSNEIILILIKTF
ncbi:MAG: molybdenum cofactor carrier [Mariniphaga sp.]|nr:molybdenum cofactor carrier [Mariniphaga sp.]